MNHSSKFEVGDYVQNPIFHLRAAMEEVSMEYNLPSESRNSDLPLDATSSADVNRRERPDDFPNDSNKSQDLGGNVTVDDTSTGLPKNVVVKRELSHVIIEPVPVDSHPSSTAVGGSLHNPSDDEENHVESLLGAADEGDTRRNYDVYNRMEGCSSDEETQTDNDDDNSIENEAEIITEHHYAVLNDDPEFGDFTGADNYTVENLSNKDDENDWAQPVTGASLSLTHDQSAAGNISCETTSGFTATFIDQASSLVSEADTVSQNQNGSEAPAPIPKFVSIQPLSAGIDYE